MPRVGCAIRKPTSVPRRDSIAHARRRRFLGSAGCAAAALAMVAALSACDGDVGEVREWTPGDHDHAANQAPQVSARSPEGHAPGVVDMGLIDLAWRRNCEKCHGPRGRGDGPEGAMVRAPDLTRSDWQDKVSDQEMLDVIRKGKNKMPGFEVLPQPVLEGLVKRIRGARASGPGGERAAPPGSRGER